MALRREKKRKALAYQMSLFFFVLLLHFMHTCFNFNQQILYQYHEERGATKTHKNNNKVCNVVTARAFAHKLRITTTIPVDGYLTYYVCVWVGE